MPLSPAISPEGHLVADDLAEDSASFLEKDEARARAVLATGSAPFLLWCASARTGEGQPLAAQYWRDVTSLYFTRYCQHGGKGVTPPPTLEVCQQLIEQAPPMRGLEYLNTDMLLRLWQELDTHVAHLTSQHQGGAEGWLRATLPHWHLVGRVTFHLAENKKDLERPFAFLATYTSGLNAEGKPRHLPLQQAIKEYAGTNNREALVNLLAPVERAAEKSDWAREAVVTGSLYRPQPWRAPEALRFLKEVPKFEEAGLSVRIPDWWKAAAPPRPQVTVEIGGGAPPGLNLGKLLSFNIEITLNGEKLTPEELKALQTAEGLVMVKGRWVEADPEKLKAVLAHWNMARAMQFQGGVSFHQALRMLAGASIDGTVQVAADADTREWSGVKAGPWLDELLEQMRDPAKIEQFSSHPDLRASLRPYQLHGVNWLHFMTRLGLGACLADDMGLGKTIQVLALLLQLKRAEKGTAPALIVAPASLIQNWKAEAAKFAPGLRVFIAHPSGDHPERLASFIKDDEAGREHVLQGVDLVLTTYGMVSRVEALKQTVWRLVILDEAQAIKNPAAGQTRAVKALQSQGRIVLTGTPVENRLGDLWSLFDFINPGLLGTAPAFGRFVKSLSRESGLHFAPLRKLARPYILRRLKTDRSIIDDLPDKTEVTAWCILTKPQAILYQQTVQALAKTLEEVEAMQRRGIVLAALLSFKQICNHPAQLSGDSHYDPLESGKFLRLRELCQPIAERQERVLVFSQFTEIIPALRETLKGIFGRDGLVLTGKTDIKQRRKLVDEFQREGGPPFFILSLKAGGTGLTLTAASHVIHFDRWWNPAVENQATDRAYRIGQKKNVLVHKFACRGTLEEKIDRLIDDKRSLADGVLGSGDEISITEMSNAELIQFVSLDVNQIISAD